MPLALCQLGIALYASTTIVDELKIQKTERTPDVIMDHEKGYIELRGRSLPMNSVEFFKPLHNWLSGYLQDPRKVTTVNIILDYFDTSSSKHIYNIFNTLRAVNEKGNLITVNWHYENGDEEMAESGKDYQHLFQMPFNFVEVDEIF